MIHDVAIVGAGPTGLSLAALLGQAGVRTVLLERNAATASEPRAVIIDDEAMRLFQTLGLADSLWPLLREGRATRYFASVGAAQPFAEVNPQGREFGWPKRLRMHQPDLERVLKDSLARWPNVDVRYDTPVDGLTQDVAGVTFATCAGAVRARWAVAADGGASPIRRALGIGTTGDTYEEPWLVLDLIDDPFDPPDTLILCDPRRPAVSVPGPHRRRRFEFMIKHGEDRERFPDPGVIAKLLAPFGYGPDRPATIDRKTVYVFHARTATRWRQGRVLLAGDAAHMMPPFMGQGLNSCLRDSWNLAWKLAAVARSQAGDALLDSYEAERRPHVEKMIRTSVTVAELAMTTSHARAAFRNLAFRVAKLSPRVRRHINGQFFKPKPQVDHGAFLWPDGARGPVAAMLPQPQLADGRPLDAALGPAWALVGLATDPPPGPEWDALAPTRLRLDAAGLADGGGPLAPLLASHTGQVLLVRPDRFVAASFAPAASVEVAARWRAVADAPAIKAAA